jgi:FtsZ-binding cell division protein ZapB
MSDPRLTAAHVALILLALDDQDYGEDPSINDCRDLCRSHEQLRSDVERLTAEHAALKTSDSQRVILEMLLSAIDTVLLGNEVSDFEESFPPVRQVIDLKDERDHLRAENAALREERDALNRILTTARGPKAGRRTAEKRSIITQLMDLERELAEARAEIARLTKPEPPETCCRCGETINNLSSRGEDGLAWLSRADNPGLVYPNHIRCIQAEAKAQGIEEGRAQRDEAIVAFCDWLRKDYHPVTDDEFCGWRFWYQGDAADVLRKLESLGLALPALPVPPAERREPLR